jgi:hypothetical protein
MDSRERYRDDQEAMRVAFNSLVSSVWTALPGYVVSYDADANTATVQPGINGLVTAPDDSITPVQLPVLPDLPVMFPRGGGCTFTFPIKKGDECLVIFVARAAAGWKQCGGIQPPNQPRMHSLADGFVYIGPMSQANKISGISADKAQLRSDDGTTYIELDPAGQIINAVAPGGMTVDSPNVHFTGKTQFDDDMHCDTTLTADTDVVGGGKHLKTHIHTGVTSGSSTSGPPQ